MVKYLTRKILESLLVVELVKITNLDNYEHTT